MLPPGDEFRLPFDALITGGNSASGYSWTAVPYGGQAPLDSPRSGTTNLFEVNGGVVAVGTYQRIWFRATVAGDHTYEFLAGGGAHWTQVTAALFGSYWPAKLTSDTADGWTDGAAVYLNPPNGETLTIGMRYLATPAGYRSAGLGVWTPSVTCCVGGDPPPSLCFCDGPFCVPISGVINGTGDPTQDLLYSEVNRGWLLVFDHTIAFGGCVFRGLRSGGAYGDPLSASYSAEVILTITGAGVATLRVTTTVADGPPPTVRTWYYTCDSNPFVCASSTFSFDHADNATQEGYGFPSSLTATTGPCTGPSGSAGTYPTNCAGTASFCLSLGGQVDEAGGDGTYYVSNVTGAIWSLAFSDSAPPIVIYEDGSGHYAVFELQGNFTCGAGGTFVFSYGNIAAPASSITVTPGACPP